jgi:hypothetical protein
MMTATVVIIIITNIFLVVSLYRTEQNDFNFTIYEQEFKCMCLSSLIYKVEATEPIFQAYFEDSENLVK